MPAGPSPPNSDESPVGLSKHESAYVDFKPDDQHQDYFRHLHQKRADTANRMIQVMVWGLVLSLPLYAATFVLLQVTSWIIGAVPSPEHPSLAASLASIDKTFDRWYAFISPLVGAAFGFYYGSSRSERKGDT